MFFIIIFFLTYSLSILLSFVLFLFLLSFSFFAAVNYLLYLSPNFEKIRSLQYNRCNSSGLLNTPEEHLCPIHPIKTSSVSEKGNIFHPQIHWGVFFIIFILSFTSFFKSKTSILKTVLVWAVPMEITIFSVLLETDVTYVLQTRCSEKFQKNRKKAH